MHLHVSCRWPTVCVEEILNIRYNCSTLKILKIFNKFNKYVCFLYLLSGTLRQSYGFTENITE